MKTPVGGRKNPPPATFDVPGIGDVRFDYKEIFSLTEDDLSDRLSKLPELSSFWRYCLSKLRGVLRSKQSELAEVEAATYLKARGDFEQTLLPNERMFPPEAYLRHRVTVDRTVSDLREEVRDLQEKVDLAQGIVESFQDLRASLMSLGADARDYGRRGRTHIRETQE